jgi:hypothetical protein
VKRHPICCFCGGQTPATTIDHQPAKIVFPNKHRPEGLEFPACSVCNPQTAADEALLAFICRFAGSSRPQAARDFNRLRDIVSTIRHRFPGLLESMKGQRAWINQGGVLVHGGTINVNQPQVDLSLCRIAAKLTLATYYNTKSCPAQVGCLINTQWTHNQNTGAFQHVQNVIDAIPATATLQAGRWKTDDTFFLKHYFEGGHLFTGAIFHQAVALIAHLVEPGITVEWEDWQHVMALVPGKGIALVK